MPAAICCIQTFGDFLGFNPYLHILAADGCFGGNGLFYVAGADVNADSLEPLFRHKILSMLKKRGLITDRVIELILSWHHSGFNVYCTDRIYPRETKSTSKSCKIYNQGIFFTGAVKLYKWGL